MDEVEEIKRRIDIVDLISSYLTLQKAGSNYRAVCPFHQEKTPSFMVSPEKQIWHCFGCSEGGDIFSFVMKMENLEFPEALKMLADRAGVKLERRKFTAEDKPDRKSRLFQINNLIARAFHQILMTHPSGKLAREYLQKRGLSNQTIKEFMIGYAPSSSQAMHQWLKKKNFTDEEIQNAGSPDRFFRRIVFPIRDVMGNVLGFTGRVLDSKQEPKYLNTPETIIFHKSRLLYNLDKARGFIKQEKATVVVEGQMDVIASFQAGVKNVVASSGTALTDEHLRLLYRYTPNIIFAFDSDTAGLLTAKKAYEMAIVEGFNVKMVSLSEYKDPGEMIEKDPSLWPKQVSLAKPVIDWYFDLAFQKQMAQSQELTAQKKKEIAREILPIIQKIPDRIEQAHYTGLLAKRLEVKEEAVFDTLAHLKEKKTNPSNSNTIVSSKPKPSAEDLLIGILLKKPAKIKEVQTKIKVYDIINKELQEIYSHLLKLYNQSDQDILARLKKGTNRQTQNKVDDLILVVNRLEKTEEDFETDFPQLVAKIKGNNRETLKSYYAEEIKKAESKNDLVRLKQLIKEFQDAISK